MKKCGAQVETADGQLYTCDKNVHLSPICRDGDVRMIGIPGLWFLGAYVIGPIERTPARWLRDLAARLFAPKETP